MLNLSLPVVDISALGSIDATDRIQVGHAIRTACLDKGFMYVTGHGIDTTTLSDVFDRSRDFFRAPLDFKLKVSCEGAPVRRGYEPLRAQRLEAGTQPDLKESYYIGIEAHDAMPQDPFDRGPNQWPELAGWRPTMEDYFERMLALGQSLFRGLALSLELPESYFDELCRLPHATLRLLRYPPQPASAAADQRGIGAHTDFGGLTILAQDDVGGLQIHDGQRGWIDVPPLPGAYVINLGDMIARWTNDRYRSTLHRVVNLSDRERYSVTFFMNGNPGHVVECLPNCLGDGEKPHYPPTTVANHIRERIRATYAAVA